MSAFSQILGTGSLAPRSLVLGLTCLNYGVVAADPSPSPGRFDYPRRSALLPSTALAKRADTASDPADSGFLGLLSGIGNNGGAGSTRANRVGGGGKASIAHGAVMIVAVLILFPIGVLSMRLLKRWYIHAALQGIALVFFLIGVFLGINIGTAKNKLFNNAHTNLGIFLTSLLLILQPLLGMFHHRSHEKFGYRGLVGNIHRYLGHALLLLSVINGGLGIQLAGQTGALKNAYIVLAVLMGIVYLYVILGKVIKGVFKKVSLKDEPKPASEPETTSAKDKGKEVAAEETATIKKKGIFF
ncbi:hypothetical protein BP5796_13150 [Coleophoma crateriformis]|uniref:Cytochrome b561 domain-containing protein n=1 Tax=Coleophoma crateriformis TaxID=565419 RepID=A0A3D8Q3T3_9HELO|nr:hypothetical protein BP5796_13150 [Coleophoma crateriformis]